MLDYETCKKLKEAGFPQEGEGHATFPEGGKLSVNLIFGASEAICYVPTLSELTNACVRRYNGSMFTLLASGLSDGWAAGYSSHEFWEDVEGSGKTPEEAVANLYLKLHE